MPTCRECGALTVRDGERRVCSACRYVAGFALEMARTLPDVVLARNISGGRPEALLVGLALDEASDEGHAAGHAAGRAEALEEALCQDMRSSSAHNPIWDAAIEAYRGRILALAGKP